MLGLLPSIMLVNPSEVLLTGICKRAYSLRQRIMLKSKVILSKKRVKKHEAYGHVPAIMSPMVPPVLTETETDDLSVEENDSSVANGTLSLQEIPVQNGTELGPSNSESGESGSDDSPAVCGCGEHVGSTQLDCTYNFSVGKLRYLILNDSSFFRDFCRARKWKDVKQTEWAVPESPEGCTYCRRQLSYSLPTNSSLAPKMCGAVEKMEEREVVPNAVLVVESTVTNSGVPYADYFRIVNRYCLTRAGIARCRLRVTTRVTYRKSVWSVIKSFIEKNILTGVKQHFSAMDEALRAAEAQTSNPVLTSGMENSLRQRERKVSNCQVEAQTVTSAPVEDISESPVAEKQHLFKRVEPAEIKSPTYFHTLIFLCGMLLLLFLLNLHLYWRVSSLEQTLLTNRHHAWPSTHRAVLTTQPSFEEIEKRRWKLLLETTIQLIDQMRASLLAVNLSAGNGSASPTVS